MQRDCEMATRVAAPAVGRPLYLICSLVTLVGACQGTIGDGAGGAAGAGPGAGSGTGSNGRGGEGGTPTGPDAQPTACMGRPPEASVLHARMLSPRQYNNTVAELLKVGGNPASAFGGGADTQLDDLGAERRANAAASIARQAVGQLAMWSPCAATVADCKQQIVDKVGTKALRHPLSPVERQQLTALFDAGVKEKDFLTGVEWFLTGVLQSPDFLYQLVRPASGEKAGTIQTISGYEMASRLSYFVWDSMPDDKLLAAAAAGLGDPATIQQQLTRMFADQRFLNGVGSFYSHWLAVENFQELARDDKAFTTDIVGALGTSLLMSATQLYATPSPNFTGLFTGESYFLNGALRAFYGKGNGAADFTATDMPGERRFGILTHPALMASLARPQKTHPINRGLFVRGKLLCQELAPPGGDIPPLPEAPVMGVTTREEVSEHSKNPQCATCHALLDPPGFALENFDQVGRRREQENGRPIDSSGTMVEGGDLDGAFARGEDLLGKFGNSQTVRNCFAQQYSQFALTGDAVREVAPADRCALERISKTFAASGDLRELVQLIATSDSFRLRLSEGAAL